MTTLTDFLLARIAEDEAMAKVATGRRDRWWVDGPAEKSGKFWIYDTGEKFEREEVATHIARHDPARVLVECKAKRSIVEAHPIITGPRILAVDSTDTDFGCETCHCIDKVQGDGIVEALGACDTLRALASVYADHPEFESEWLL